MITDSTPFDDAHERRELGGIAAWKPKVLHSANGYFIGAATDHGIERLSFEYWTTKEAAEYALKFHRWTPRDPKSSAWDWGD